MTSAELSVDRTVENQVPQKWWVQKNQNPANPRQLLVSHQPAPSFKNSVRDFEESVVLQVLEGEDRGDAGFRLLRKA